MAVRIYTLAKDLKLDSKELVDLCTRAGIQDKGSALASMIELMAGPLIGDLTSAQSLALDGRLGGAPHHGELILAFDPRFFSGRDPALDQAGAEALFTAITGQGARLPSQRRFEARARSQIHGVQVARTLHADILALINEG